MNTNTYEIILACLCCSAETPLGTVQAITEWEAKEKAVARWPDAREEEMVFRLREQQEICSAFPVEQLAS